MRWTVPTEHPTSASLATEIRRELVGVLAVKGMSTRMIAPVVGVSDVTVHNDRKVLSRLAPTPEPTRHIDRIPADVNRETGEIGLSTLHPRRHRNGR